MSLPRVLTLEKNKLISAPAQELERLRGKRYHWENLELFRGLHKLDVSGRALELTLALRLDEADEAGIVLALAEDESEGLYVVYKRAQGVLCLEPRSPHREKGIWSQPYEYPLELKENRLELRIFLDGSAVEVFAQGTGLTGRFYSRDESRRVALYADGAATLEGLEAWIIKNIWSNSQQS